MTRNYKITASLVLAALFLCTGAARADEAQACSAQTVKGAYGWRAEGTIPTMSIAGIGTFTFDGNGAFTGVETASFNGETVRVTWKGTYTMNPNCLVSVTMMAEGGAYTGFGAKLELVFVDGGKEFEGIQIDSAGAVFTFVGKQL